MNIHEYQAKRLLKEFGAPVSDGRAVFSAKEAEAAAKELPGPLYVVKAQIHAGGRGKGKFKQASAGDKPVASGSPNRQARLPILQNKCSGQRW